MTSTSIHISSDSETFEDSENCPGWEEEDEMEERSSKFVYNQRGEREALGPMLAQGGEGKIFPLLDNPSTLVKLFHDKILCDQTRKIRLRDKLRAMSKLRKFGRDNRFAWRACRSLMKKISGLVWHASLRRTHTPSSLLSRKHNRNFSKMDANRFNQGLPQPDRGSQRPPP